MIESMCELRVITVRGVELYPQPFWVVSARNRDGLKNSP
jgi:hypothetical protein